MDVSRGSQKLDEAGPHLLGWEACLIRPFPTSVTTAHLVARGNSWCIIMGILWKSLNLHIPPLNPLEVIGTDVHQMATYDFLLVFPSNCGPVSYHFRDKGQ